MGLVWEMRKGAWRCMSDNLAAWVARSQTSKYLKFIAVLACEAWFCILPGWPAGTALLGTLIVLVKHEEGDAARARYWNADAKLLAEFLQTLPSDGGIAFINGLDFSSPFSIFRLNDLSYFRHAWNDAEHEFHDKSLEKRRYQFWSLVDKFLWCVTLSTFPFGEERQSVPVEWSREHPDHFEKVVRELNELARQVVIKHQELVRLGKRNLRI
jgi:hypothetical protein